MSALMALTSKQVADSIRGKGLYVYGTHGPRMVIVEAGVYVDLYPLKDGTVDIRVQWAACVTKTVDGWSREQFKNLLRTIRIPGYERLDVAFKLFPVDTTQH